jgi:hypothetical protein
VNALTGGCAGLEEPRELFWVMSNGCVPIHQTDRFIYLRSHTGIAGGDIRGKRKTVQVPIRWLWFNRHNK